MKATLLLGTALAALGLFTACQSLPPGAEKGPHGTMAYEVPVESSEPGIRIEANGQDVGRTPLRLKIFGDPDGTFHDFGSAYYVVRAIPANTNQFVQTKVFNTGRIWGLEDRIPQQIFFDMNKKPEEQAPPGAYGPPPPYYSPYYYGPYYGPRVYIGPGYRYRRGWWP